RTKPIALSAWLVVSLLSGARQFVWWSALTGRRAPRRRLAQWANVNGREVLRLASSTLRRRLTPRRPARRSRISLNGTPAPVADLNECLNRPPRNCRPLDLRPRW